MMTRQPTFVESISTIVVMIIIVITGFVGFGIPIQALLILASAYAAWIAKRVGLKWSDLEEGITGYTFFKVAPLQSYSFSNPSSISRC